VGGSKKQTIGYKYSLGIHTVSLKGPVDALKRITFAGDKVVYSGSAIDEQISINKPDAFGGESKEGGVVGSIDVLSGGPTQTKNDYLQSQFGTDIPAFRGVAGLVFRQVQLSNHAYLKPWVERWQRIHVRQDGIAQWYDAKSEIITSKYSFGYDDVWKYKVVSAAEGGSSGVPSEYISPSYDDTAWSTGNGGFGSGGPGAGLGVGTFVAAGEVGKGIWLRKQIDVDVPQYVGDITLDIWHDDGVWIWWNGTPVAVTQDPSQYFHSTATIPVGDITQSNVIVMQVLDSVPDGSPSHIYAGMDILSDGIGHSDMNPAHIIRECITDPDWGSRHPESDCDDADWTPVADALYAEEFGLSYFWDNPNETNDDLKEEILRHIDATLYVSRSTGKFILKLIRDDYDEGSLVTIDESNIARVENYARPSFGELTNTVTVRYWDAYTGNQGAVTVDNPALVQMQGGVNAVTIDYPSITNKSLAVRVALRDLRALSTDLVTCTIYANSAAKSINPGDAFKFEFADYHDGYLIMRADKIAYGDGRSDRVRIECVQDVFSISTIQSVSSNDTEWTDPSQTPDPATYRIVEEAPYYELVQRLGESQTEALLTDNEFAGFLVATAANPGSAINAILNVDAGSGYEDFGVVEFSPYAFLDGDLAQEAGPSTFSITGAVDVDDVVVGTHVQIGSELMRVDAVSSTSITAGRGVLDTVPNAHTDGDVVIFWDEYAGSNEVEYGSSASVDVKLLTSSGAGTVDISAATADTVTFDQRAYRPYPPGNVKINTDAYPEAIGGSDALTVSWSHRDRQLQTAGTLQDTTETDIGPETGTTYTLRIYGETDTLIRTYTGLTGASQEYPVETEKTDSEIPSDTPGDEDFDSVSSLLHMDDTDGSATFTDVTGKTWTTTGNAQIDTDQSKFGGSSGLFDGNGDYITSPSSDDFGFGAGDFTVEGWFRPTSWNTNGFLADFRLNAGNSFMVWCSQSGQLNRLGYSTESGTAFVYGATQFTLSAWNHWAVARSGTTVRGFLSGTLVFTTTDSRTFASPQGVYIGSSTSASQGAIGHIDDVRITKGVARYTASFTPPDAPFDDSASGEAGYRINGELRIELESVRDGLTSYQNHDITVLREGYGFNYGKLYGGSA
jgi:hypothetical protein